jgi:prolyl-tRNA synthetase
LEPAHQIKTMAYMALTPADKVGAAEIASPVVVLLRGDHTINQAKLAALFPSARELRPMVAEEIVKTRFILRLVTWDPSVSTSCPRANSPRRAK